MVRDANWLLLTVGIEYERLLKMCELKDINAKMEKKTKVGVRVKLSPFPCRSEPSCVLRRKSSHQ